MIRLGKETKLSGEQVLERAIAFFGEQGQGLSITERSSRHVSLEGCGGFVTVEVRQENGATKVDVSTREWETQAKGFIRKL